MEKAKIGLIQFCLSAPKTDVSKTKWNDSLGVWLFNNEIFLFIKIENADTSDKKQGSKNN